LVGRVRANQYRVMTVQTIDSQPASRYGRYGMADDAPLPWLMRQARGVYRSAIVEALAEAGCDDMPRNGAFVLADLEHTGAHGVFAPQADLVASLQVSKQAASQLIDTLVLREYLERRNDPEDRRRMGVRLTDRGRAAAAAIHRATDAIDATVAHLITADELTGLRAGLAAYGVIRERSSAGGGAARE
jgi:DNA-binding MarR family transcriptional regulator